MSTVTTSKQIDPDRFAVELGAGFLMYDNDAEGTRTIDAPGVSLAALQAAVDAHVFVGEVAARNTNRQAIIDGIAQGLDAMQQIIDATPVTFSNLSQAQTACQQIQVAIKAEARQIRRLSRLALNLLDGSE